VVGLHAFFNTEKTRQLPALLQAPYCGPCHIFRLPAASFKEGGSEPMKKIQPVV
jgi:hypothetical protein